MSVLVAAFAFAVLAWWLGTGTVLSLQRRLGIADSSGDLTRASDADGGPLGQDLQAWPSRREPILIGLVGGLCLILIAWLSSSASALATIAAFSITIVLWGCLELSHYLGLVTGTHARPCPPDCHGWSRFRLALGTSIWHELSVVLIGAALFAMVAASVNPVAWLTYLVLWLMRWSAKLNLFLGVPNFSSDWWPARLGHLQSYLKRSPVSAFFPISLLLAGAMVILLWSLALDATGNARLIHALPAALLLLAMLEHLFMLIPFADSVLWNRLFGTSPRSTGREASR